MDDLLRLEAPDGTDDDGPDGIPKPQHRRTHGQGPGVLCDWDLSLAMF